VRGSDTVARLGGDEFVVLAGDLERAGYAAHIAEKICDMLRVALPLEGELLSVGCSLGISVFPDDGEDADALIAQADKAMYAAKSRRERGYAYFAAAG
jgi:diguanylate cyclase (GGDEF)-like protein